MPKSSVIAVEMVAIARGDGKEGVGGNKRCGEGRVSEEKCERTSLRTGARARGR